MTFRQYSVVAILLFSMTLVGQTAAPKAPSQAPSSKASAAVPVRGGPYPIMSATAEQRARQIFQWWESGQIGPLWSSFSEGLRKRSESEAKFAAYTKSLQEKMGRETKMVQETVVPSMMSYDTVYSRLSDYSKAKVSVMTTIMINERGEVQALLVGPEPNVPEGRYAGYQDTAKLRLPFNGEWIVGQGGHSVFENGYMQSELARFSVDFFLVKNGQAFAGDLGQNESFYCFGQPLLAPADGTVVRVESGFADNPPGSKAQDSPQGNYVVISHGNKEFSVLDHLKQNSIPVKKGDTVKQGDVVGACGNSGSSPAPHVHFQLQNTAGLPPPEPLASQFHDYVADGKPVAVGEPTKGQMVSNAPMTSSEAPAGKNQPPAEPVKK